jgi:hypothetical protein
MRLGHVAFAGHDAGTLPQVTTEARPTRFNCLSSDERTRKYVARRLAEGKTIREIMRVLKRYVAREIYPHLVA